MALRELPALLAAEPVASLSPIALLVLLALRSRTAAARQRPKKSVTFHRTPMAVREMLMTAFWAAKRCSTSRARVMCSLGMVDRKSLHAGIV